MSEKEIIKNEGEETPTTASTQKEEEEDGKGCATIIELVLAIGLIIAAIYWNPSREDHKAVIEENLKEMVQSKSKSGHMPSFESLMALNDVAENFEYHNIYVCSWTTARIDGEKGVLSIGVLGWTHAMF